MRISKKKSHIDDTVRTHTNHHNIRWFLNINANMVEKHLIRYFVEETQVCSGQQNTVCNTDCNTTVEGGA